MQKPLGHASVATTQRYLDHRTWPSCAAPPLPGAALATGIVGTLVLVGGAVVVHDTFDTDA